MALTPTIHLNGTSREALLDQVTEAAQAVYAALGKVCDAAPNARDYYPQGPEAFTAARDQHDARCDKLREVFNELQELALAIDGAGR